MRTLMLAALCCALTGCSSIVSLDPVVADAQSVSEPGLVGVWSTEKEEDICIVRPSGGTYKIRYIHSGINELEAKAFRIGEALFLDVWSPEDGGFQVQAHTIVRVWPEGGVVRWAYLDSDWLKEKARKELSVHESGKRLVLVAPTESVRAFLVRYGSDPKAAGDTVVWHRM